MVKPRIGVGHHFYNDFDTAPEVLEQVRKTYDGPLALALDYMVFNVTRDDIRVRMSAIDEEVWPSPALKPKNPPDGSKMIPFSDFTKSGALPMLEIVEPIFDEVNEIVDRLYELGIVDGKGYLLSGSPAEKVNQVLHRVLYELLEQSFADARPAVLERFATPVMAPST